MNNCNCAYGFVDGTKHHCPNTRMTPYGKEYCQHEIALQAITNTSLASIAQIEIQREHTRAKSMHPDNFNSYHEGYAVMLEEVNELWDEIKKKNPDKDKLRSEAVQIGAMVTRFISELL